MAETLRIDGVTASRLPADDRGLAYGDGVFRTLCVRAGRPVAWPVHLQRLAHDCMRLGLDCPSADALAGDCAALFARGGDGVLKIIVTRGSGGRGYTPPEPAVCRRIVSAHALPAHAARAPAPLVLERSPIVLGCQPALAGVKHLNRLEQVLARAACARAGVADALTYDAAGTLVATTMRNLLLLDERGRWLTPSLARAGVAGATRQRLMTALAAQGAPVTETELGTRDLARLRAAIACNSVGGVAAVTAIEGHRLADSERFAADCRRLLAVDWRLRPKADYRR